MMSKILFFLVSILASHGAFAVKGENLIFDKSVEEVSCLIKAKYDDLDGREGICSGVIVGTDTIQTAKHCLFHAPTQMAKGEGDPILRELRLEEIINKKKVTVECQGKIYQPQSFVIHPKVDLAQIKLDAQFEKTSKIISNEQMQSFMTNQNDKECASFGFGFNHLGQIGAFSGVKIDYLKVYKVQDAFLEVEIDSDFKQLSLYFANSMFDEIFMNQAHFPKLVSYAKKYGVEPRVLSDALSGFKRILKENGLEQSSLFRMEEGPRFKKLFFKHFKSIYQLVYKHRLLDIKKKYLSEKRPLHRFILNVENTKTLEKAGIDYGDSGGAFMCQLKSDEWVLVGINSRILTDSNLGYITRPWEPMHTKPESRMTKNGEVIPLVW